MKRNNLKKTISPDGPTLSQVWRVAPCYEMLGNSRKPWCRKSGHKIDPESRFQIKKVLVFQNGDGKMQLALLDLIDPKTGRPALIWDMHIFVTKQSAGKGKL